MKQSEIIPGRVYTNNKKDRFRMVITQGFPGEGIEHLLFVNDGYIKDNEFTYSGIPYHITKKAFARWAKEDITGGLILISCIKKEGINV